MKSIFKSGFYLVLIFLFSAKAFASVNGIEPGKEYYYQIKVYHLKTQAQEDRLDKYLKNAYVPAMHRLGIKKIGVFKPVTADSLGKRVYVLTPFRNWEQLETAGKKIQEDDQYIAAGREYIDAAYNDEFYSRIETIVLRAFPQMPMPDVPVLTASKVDRVYELRSYESSSEQFNVNKVQMFNDGNEVALFKRLGFNAVFYAEVIAGSHMPNLMYMTTFNGKADRDKHWDTFSNDPEWKTLVARPEYQHNVSKADITFLHPTEYSDF